MDEQQEQQQVVEQRPQITVEEITAAVDAAMRGQGETLDAMSQDLQQVRVTLEKSGENEQSQETNEDVVYTVLIDDVQIATAKSAVQTLSTLSLVLVIAVSILCGLQLWSIFARSWSHV